MAFSFVDSIYDLEILHLNIHGEAVQISVTDPELFDELCIELSHFLVEPTNLWEPAISVHFQEYGDRCFSRKESRRIRSLKKVKLTTEIENYSDVANLATYLFARKEWNLDEAVILILSQLGYLLRLKLSQSNKLAVFHGASLFYGGQGILFVGESGAGKTSLSYLCTRQEFRYLSDEDSFVVFEPKRSSFTLLGFQRRMRIQKNVAAGFGASQNRGGQFSGFGEDGIVYDPRKQLPNAYCLRAPLKKIIILNNNKTNEKLTLEQIPAEEGFTHLMKYFEGATTEYGNSRDKIARYNRQGFEVVSQMSRCFELYALNYYFEKHFHALPFKIKSALSSNEFGYAAGVSEREFSGIHP